MKHNKDIATIPFPWLQFISEFWGWDNQHNLLNFQKIFHNLKLLIFSSIFYVSVFSFIIM